MPTKKPKTPKCEVKNMIGCNGVAVCRLTGKKKGDPVFWCCLGCRAMLSIAGVKLKEVQ